MSEDSLTIPEEIWYVNGHSFVLHGKKRAGYAVISNFETIEAKPLPPGTLAQLVDLIALSSSRAGKRKKYPFTLALRMPFWCYMHRLLLGKKEAT